LVIQESRQGAFGTQAGRELVNRIVGAAGHLRCGVRIEPYGAHKEVKGTEKGVLAQYKEIVPKVFLYAGAATGTNHNAKRQPKRAVGKGRNDLCPCGSGRKYKRCCMGRAGN
jgi:hypothetical protein